MQTSKHTSLDLRGFVYGVLAAFNLAVYLIINRYVYTHYHPEALNYTTTFLIAASAFALISLLINELKAKFRTTHKNPFPVILNGVLAGVAIGLLVIGQRYTTAINASILATVGIATTAIFSDLMLKQRFNQKQFLALIGMFVGLYIAIVGARTIKLNGGDIIILCATVILGFSNTFAKKLMKAHSSGFLTDVRLICGGIIFLILGSVLGTKNLIVTSAGVWPLVSGFFFWLNIKTFYAAVHKIGANRATVLSNSHPVITPIAGVLLLSEPYSVSKLIGSVIIVASVYALVTNQQFRFRFRGNE